MAGLGIGQVAERTGLSVDALRFYEREGLFAGPVRRDAAGRRRYTEDDVEWLQICIRFRSSGMPLPEVRRYAALVRQGPGNEQERLALLRRHQQHLRVEIAKLTDCLDLIDYKVDVYEKHVAAGTASALWTGSPDDVPE